MTLERQNRLEASEHNSRQLLQPDKTLVTMHLSAALLSAGGKQKIKAAHGPNERHPDVEEGGITANAAQKDVFYKV